MLPPLFFVALRFRVGLPEDLPTPYSDCSIRNASDIGKLQTLTAHDWCGWPIGSLPSDVGKFPDIQVIRARKLHGTLPTDIGKVRGLKYVQVFSGFLGGTVPSEVGELSEIQVLDFQNNRLQGSIPTEIARLQKLHALALWYNSLEGKIPSELGKLPSTPIIMLGTNSFSGTIPSVIFGGGKSKCSQHISEVELGTYVDGENAGLDLSDNYLHGTIPTELGNPRSCLGIRYFLLRGNQLSGGIPSELSRHSRVRHFDVSNNSLAGIFPIELCSLIDIELLYVDNNLLTGSLPSELGNIVAPIVDLYFNENFLRGSIPSEIGRTSHRQEPPPNSGKFWLDGNSLTGSLPTELGTLQPKLNWFSIERNFLTGTFATEIAKLQTLQYIQLSENRLQGTLPCDIGNLPRLHYLALYKNSCGGWLPSELTKIHKTSLSFNLAFNKFEGPFPSGFLQGAMILHRNRFSGKININREQVGRLQALTLHENNIGGVLPARILDDDEATMTLHGNHLSCALPDDIFASKKRSILAHSSTFMGNFFSVYEYRIQLPFLLSSAQKVPSWLPDRERDPLLYQAPMRTRWNFLITLILGFAFFVSVSVRLFGYEKVKAACHRIPWDLNYECWFSCAIVKLSIVTNCGMLPAYMYGANWYECPPVPADFSVLSDATSEWVAGGLFILYFAIGYMSVKRCKLDTGIAATAVAEEITSRYTSNSQIFAYFTWFWISGVLSLPSSLYMVVDALPKENTLASWFGKIGIHIIFKITPIVGALVNAFGLPFLAQLYGRRYHVNRIGLELWGRCFSYWIIPTFWTVILHENCFGWWRYTWLICNSNTLDRPFEVPFFIPCWKLPPILKTNDICEIPSVLQVVGNGKCGRAVVSSLSPLLVKNLLTEALLVPCLTMAACWFDARYFGKRKLVNVCEWHVMSCSIWFDITVTFGALIPIVPPLVGLAFWTNLMAYRLIVQLYRKQLGKYQESYFAKECQPVLSRLIAYGSVFNSAVALQVSFRCGGLLCVAALLILLDCVLSQRMIGQPGTTQTLEVINEIEMTMLSPSAS